MLGDRASLSAYTLANQIKRLFTIGDIIIGDKYNFKISFSKQKVREMCLE